MPIPTFTKLGVSPQFGDIVNKINTLVGELSNIMLNLDSLNVTSLSAGTVIVYDLDGGPGTITLNKDGMVINNGTVDTFKVDIDGNVTMTSALIQSSTGYPKVVMDPANDLFAAYETATDYIELEPIGAFNSAPALNIVQGAEKVVMGFGAGTISPVGLYSTSEFELNFSNGLQMPGDVRFTDWTNLKNLTTSLNLQQTLDAKADDFTGVSGTVYVASSSGGPTTTAITFTNGIRTS